MTAPSPDYLRGIAAGIEAAAQECCEWQLNLNNCEAAERWNKAGGFMNAVAGATNACFAAIRSLNPAEIAAKNPTAEQTAENGLGSDALATLPAQPLGADDWQEAKRKVEARYPGAFATEIGRRNWQICSRHKVYLASAPTEPEAWIKAAKEIGK